MQNNEECVTSSVCEHQQLLCQAERLRQAQEAEKRLTKIEEALRRIEEKLDEVVDLTPRVSNLESWRGRLNGKAEALAEFERNHPKPVEIKALEPPHRSTEDDGDHREERTNSEVVVQMTAKTMKLLLVAIAVSLFVLLGLALVAGEKGWVVLTKTHDAVQHSHNTLAPKVERNLELLRHMHQFHGGPDPDADGMPKDWRP